MTRIHRLTTVTDRAAMYTAIDAIGAFSCSATARIIHSESQGRVAIARDADTFALASART